VDGAGCRGYVLDRDIGVPSCSVAGDEPRSRRVADIGSSYSANTSKHGTSFLSVVIPGHWARSRPFVLLTPPGDSWGDPIVLRTYMVSTEIVVAYFYVHCTSVSPLLMIS